jgi:hypothetical protein
MRLRPFPSSRRWWISSGHELVFVIEQNRDGQMRTLLINEGNLPPQKLMSPATTACRGQPFTHPASGKTHCCPRHQRSANPESRPRRRPMTFFRPTFRHPNCRPMPPATIAATTKAAFPPSAPAAATIRSATPSSRPVLRWPCRRTALSRCPASAARRRPRPISR